MRARNGNRHKAPVFKRTLDKNVQRFIITAAQNATPVHTVFWRCLLTARNALGAELLVVPVRYKNPTSRWTLSQANDESWAPEVTPFLWNQRRTMNKNLILLGDVKMQPTAVEPLTGFESITGSESAILAHTKLQMKSIATPANKMAKIITTTGACTVPNYTDSKAGKLGEFHHALAAVIVEIEGGIFHLRHINFDTRSGSFVDLDKLYTPDGTETAPQPAALVIGDTHVDFVDPHVEQATGEMIRTLRPKVLVWHDLLDGFSVNPHHIGNPFAGIAKQKGNRLDVRSEVRRALKYIEDHTPGETVSVVIASNHDAFLRRWINDNDWRKLDPINRAYYLELALKMAHATMLGVSGTETPDPFRLAFEDEFAGTTHTRFRALGPDESYVLAGIELSLHGDRGPNGTRGSAQNLRRIGVRTVIGHSHTPQINEGCYQVGTSTRLRLEYNTGPSSWLNAHCVVHANGKRQLIIIIGKKWRL